MHLPRTALAGLLTVTAIATAIGAATAADSADLSVKGAIKPSACNVNLSGDAVVDFGTIAASSLSPTDITRLTATSFSLTIQCDAATRIAVTTIDGRKGTADPAAGSAINASSTAWYGAGSIDGRPVGAYTLRRDEDTTTTADGAEAAILYSQDNGQSWSNTMLTDWAEPEHRTHAWSTAGASSPGAYKTISQQWRLDFAIAKRNDLPPLTDAIPLDGVMTFQVKYL